MSSTSTEIRPRLASASSSLTWPRSIRVKVAITIPSTPPLTGKPASTRSASPSRKNTTRTRKPRNNTMPLCTASLKLLYTNALPTKTTGRSMALKATIFKATLHIADMDRQYYSDHHLTVSRNQLETDECLLKHLLPFEFGRAN